MFVTRTYSDLTFPFHCNYKCKYNLFTHGAPGVHKNFEIWKCWFLRRGENLSTRRKTSRSRVDNQQQTQPTYDAGCGNRTQATLVGSEQICPGLILIRCMWISISITKCLIALLLSFNITRFLEYRQLK